jgi:hypothetical protein
MDDLLLTFVATNFAACRLPPAARAAFDSGRSVRQAVSAGSFDLSNGRLVDGLVLRRRQRKNKINNASSHFGIANP